MNLPEGLGSWLAPNGPQSDVVVSTRIRLARNLSGHRFHGRATPEQRSTAAEDVRAAMRQCTGLRDLTYWSVEELGEVERAYLVERHLISRDLADDQGDRGVAVGTDESVSIMINEEDHLRIQILLPGLQPWEAWNQAHNYDLALGSILSYAFSAEFGHLTACPTNVGTGVRVSVMVHLPALVIAGQTDKLFRSMVGMRCAVRGLFGEGTQAQGDFFQISNQASLGVSEEDLVRTVGDTTLPDVLRHEREWRQRLLQKRRLMLEDRVGRALGILKHARSLRSEEAMNLLSSLRLGTELGLLKGIGVPKINHLFLQMQPAHMQVTAGVGIAPGERDRTRADLFRRELAEVD